MDFITSPGLYVYRTLRRKLQLSLIEQFYKRAFTEHPEVRCQGRRDGTRWPGITKRTGLMIQKAAETWIRVHHGGLCPHGPAQHLSERTGETAGTFFAIRLPEPQRGQESLSGYPAPDAGGPGGSGSTICSSWWRLMMSRGRQAVGQVPVRLRSRPDPRGLWEPSDPAERKNGPLLGGAGYLHRRGSPAVAALTQEGRRAVGRGDAGPGGIGSPGARGPGDSPGPRPGGDEPREGVEPWDGSSGSTA